MFVQAKIESNPNVQQTVTRPNSWSQVTEKQPRQFQGKTGLRVN
jgi:hypothetical protein